MKNMIELEEDVTIRNKDKRIILEKGDKIRFLNESLENIYIFTEAKRGKKVLVTVEDFHNGLSYTHTFLRTLFSNTSLDLLAVIDDNDDSNLFIKLSKLAKIEGDEKRLSLRYSDGSSVFMR